MADDLCKGQGGPGVLTHGQDQVGKHGAHSSQQQRQLRADLTLFCNGKHYRDNNNHKQRVLKHCH